MIGNSGAGAPSRRETLLALSDRVFREARLAGLGSTEEESRLLDELSSLLQEGVELSGDDPSVRWQARSDDLLQSQKLEALGRLTGGIAHDFNNMLTVISSYATFAIEDLPEESPTRDDVIKIKEAGDRAAALVGQLLAFSRKQVMDPEPLDLREVLNGLLPMFRRVLGESIDVLMAGSEEIGSIVADRGQIEQVLMNLAVNSRDAMPDGGRLVIETSEVELNERESRRLGRVEPGRYAVLSVTDTGIGMDEETRSKLFEPFFTTKEKGKGTGLGLPTAYGIIEQSGGCIQVQSREGEGTTFTIYLPLSEDSVSSKPTAPEISLTGGSETVLLVEDEEPVRAIAERALCKAGYKVLVAANAGEAFLLCEREEQTVDLLVTDVVLPHLSGKQLADRLRKINQDMRVLFMSGYAHETVAYHGVAYEGVHLLAKPFSANQLIKRVRAVLDLQRGPAVPK
ncbi:MAG: ATP-binding protein [Myxococcota bacterium]